MLSRNLRVVAIKKGAFRSPSTEVTNFFFNSVAVVIYYLFYYLIQSGHLFFQLTFKLAEIFERRCKPNGKIQASTPTTNKGKPNVNKMELGLVTGFMGERKTR